MFEGKYLRQAQLDNPAGWIGNFQDLFDSLEVIRTDTVDGKKVATVRASAGELPPRTLYFDLETGDVVKTEVSVLESSMGMTIPTVTTHSDFRVVQGERIPFRSTSSNPFSGETLIEVTEVKFLDEVDTALFE